MSAIQKYSSIGDFVNKWLAIISVITAAVFGLIEYLEHKEKVRVERSLSYVERFNSSSYTEFRNSLSDVVEQESAKIISTLSDSSLSAEEVSQRYNKLIIDMIRDNKLEAKLRQLFDFHEEVVLCATSALCDEFVIRSFFATNAKQLFKAFYPYVCDQRTKWNNDEILQNLESFYLSGNAQICN